MQASVQAIAPALAVVDGSITTTSNEVAQHFSKQHKHVLDKIAALLADLPSEFAEPNFRLSEFIDSTGRTLPAYRLTRDGFTLLAMGFTGKRALQFKLAYIDAFNRMEAELLAKRLPPAYLTPAQKREIQKAITRRVYAHPAHTRSAEFARVYIALRDHFHVSRYSEIPQAEYSNALALVDTIAELKPIQAPAQQIVLTAEQVQQLRAYATEVRDLARAVTHGHGGPVTPRLYSLAEQVLLRGFCSIQKLIPTKP